MTPEQMQAIADRTLRSIALKYGSTSRRDFFVIEKVLDEAIRAQTSAHGLETNQTSNAAHEGVTLPVGEKPALRCRGGGPHYCPNCDRTFDDILASLRRK